MFKNLWHKLGAAIAAAGVFLPILGFIPGKIPSVIVGAVGLITGYYTDVDKVISRNKKSE